MQIFLHKNAKNCFFSIIPYGISLSMFTLPFMVA